MIVGCEQRVGRERRVEYFFTNPYSAILPFCLEKKNDFGRIGGKFKRYCALHLLGCGSID